LINSMMTTVFAHACTAEQADLAAFQKNAESDR